MKARVKSTGEIVDIAEYSTIYAENYDTCFYPNELEILDYSEDYWTRLEHQYAGMAMQGMCADYTKFTKDNDGTISNTEMIVENARLIAHALVEKMEEERK